MDTRKDRTKTGLHPKGRSAAEDCIGGRFWFARKRRRRGENRSVMLLLAGRTVLVAYSIDNAAMQRDLIAMSLLSSHFIP